MGLPSSYYVGIGSCSSKVSYLILAYAPAVLVYVIDRASNVFGSGLLNTDIELKVAQSAASHDDTGFNVNILRSTERG